MTIIACILFVFQTCWLMKLVPCKWKWATIEDQSSISWIICWHLVCTRKSVKKSVAQLIATVAKHDLPENRWPELFQFLQQYIQSEIAEQREVCGFFNCWTSFAWRRLWYVLNHMLIRTLLLLLWLLLTCEESFSWLFW